MNLSDLPPTPGPVRTGRALPPLRTAHLRPAPGGAWGYDLWGRHGRPLVLIPAVLFDRTMFWPAAADLRPHATVVAVDLPGHGTSAGRDRYDPGALVDDLAGLVAGLGLTRAPVVVGHGASAALAVLFAARYATHAVVTVDAPAAGRLPGRVDEYLAGMQLDALPGQFRDLVRPVGDGGLLTGYADCLDRSTPPAAARTARLDLHSQPSPGAGTVYHVPSRFAPLTALPRFVRDLCAVL